MIAAALALAGAITAHHSGLPMNAHYDMEMSAVAELCLGVFAAVGAALAAAALVILALGRWRPALFRIPAVELPARPVPPARARDGPELLSLLCVSRR